MSFKDEIELLKNERKNNEELFIDEVLDYFKQKFESDNYKNYLKNRIKNAINEGNDCLTFQIRFYSPLHTSNRNEIWFNCCGVNFKKHESDYNKQVFLNSIQYKLGDKISELFSNIITNFGLNIVDTKRLDYKNCYNEYDNEIKISW